MKLEPMKSNTDLKNFLIHLADEVRASGAPNASEDLLTASRFASGSPSEFLHEAQAALKRTMQSFNHALSGDQRDAVKSVIKQIETAFKQGGGA
jgi:hypothetical protein